MPSNESNQACWVDAPGKPYSIRDAPMPTPTDKEVIIRTHAVALNPVDAMRQQTGLLIAEDGFPWIVGCDGAGTIHAVGADVKNLKVGDRVVAVGDEWATGKSSNSSFQRYFGTTGQCVCKIPDHVSFEDGVVLPTTLATAAGALFEEEGMQLSWPRFNGTDEQTQQKEIHGKDVVVVWGGSSCVGLSAIQMLILAGYHVIATAGKQNFDLVKEAGAQAVFDYRDDTCVQEVCKWVEERGLTCAGVLASVIDRTGRGFQQCAEVAKRLPGRKFVGTTLARGMMELPDLGEGIKTSACALIMQEDLLQYVMKEWMPKALETGELKCLPRPEVVGQGLESIAEATELMGKGVSGTKLVVAGI